MADKPRTSLCPSVSVADITDCATSPAYMHRTVLVCSGLLLQSASGETEADLGNEKWPKIWMY